MRDRHNHRRISQIRTFKTYLGSRAFKRWLKVHLQATVVGSLTKKWALDSEKHSEAVGSR